MLAAVVFGLIGFGVLLYSIGLPQPHMTGPEKLQLAMILGLGVGLLGAAELAYRWYQAAVNSQAMRAEMETQTELLRSVLQELSHRSGSETSRSA